MVAYGHLTQHDDESTSQYLIRAKVLLEHINHTSKLSQEGIKQSSSHVGTQELPHQMNGHQGTRILENH